MSELDHPLVRVIRQVAKPGETEPFVIDADGAAIIEYGLLKYADDPSLPDAIVGIFALITGLFEHANSPSAAITLAKIVAECRPKLTALNKIRSAHMEARFDALTSFVGEESKKRAPSVDAQAPEGSLKVRSFIDPGDRRPIGLRGRTRRRS